MWRWLIFSLVVIGLHTGLAQSHADKESKWHQHGNQLMKHGNYHAAIKIFQRLDSLYPANPLYSYALGQCTFRVGDKPSSLFFFLKAKQLGYQGTTLLFDLSKAYYFNNDISNALFYLNQFEQTLSSGAGEAEKERAEVSQLRKHITSSQDIIDKKLSITLINMGTTVNSPQADYVPIPVGDDQLVFTSRRHKSTGGKLALDGAHFEDIYTTKKDSNGQWMHAIHFKGFNTSKHDANVALNQDGTLLFIYKATHGGDLFFSNKKADGEWSRLQPLREINSLYWEGSACLSFDETMLFFSSDRPGGFGGSDLYSASLSPDGKWSNITNLGPEINTSSDEDAPFLYKDGKTLFFSSKGHNSLGGYDIFSAHLTAEGKWNEVKNMGFPINTFDDDIYFHLTSDGSIGYFTSFHHSNFREKSIGEKDIFQISRPHGSPALFLLKGKVLNKKSGEPLTAVVSIKEISAHDQRQVTDASTGLFKFELQFEKHYRLSVEIGGKIYDSGELYFPYQADLFEYFMPVPLDSIPTFDLKLSDLVQGTRSITDAKPMVLKKEQHAIVLVRKAAFDEPDLKKLMESDKIPFSFRAKIAQQQKDTSFLDTKEEGNLKPDLYASLLDTSFVAAPVKMQLPDNARRETIDPTVAKQNHDYDLMKKELRAQEKQPAYKELSPDEQQLIDRLAHQLLSTDTSYQVNTFDLLYYENLSPEEKNKLKSEVIARTRTEGTLSDEILKHRFLLLQELVESSKIKALTKSKLAFYDKEAWDILYTIETGGFEQYDHLQFQATLTKRNNGSTVAGEKLIVMEDDGLLFREVITDAKGDFTLQNLVAGKRYHILVNDYTIALTGLSRYQLRGSSMTSAEEDYMLFYNQLTPEEKRRVDRLSASQYLKELYEKNPLLVQEDPLSYAQLSESDKQFTSLLQHFMDADSVSDPDFIIDQRQSERYESMDYQSREKYDRLINRRALLNEQGNVELSDKDSVFYQKLSEKQKGYITEISKHRTQRKHMMGAWLSTEEDSQYWFEMNQIDTSWPAAEKVRVSGRITSTTHSITQANVSVALMNESGQLISVVEIDSTGQFIFYSIETNKKFKILLSKPAVGEAADYALNDLKMAPDEINLYDKLSATERRRIDRIIARNLSSHNYLQDPSLASQDEEVYQTLSASEKAFIMRLQQYLFADTVTEINSALEKRDHQTYYASLNARDRAFVNRYVIHSYRDTLATERLMLSKQDSMVYRHLSAVQKEQISCLQQKRKKAEDIFAENPVLVGTRRRIALDSILPANNGAFYEVKGILMDLNNKGVSNVNVYLSDKNGNLLTMVTTNHNGDFSMINQTTEEELFVMVETASSHFFASVDYQVHNFRVEIKGESVHSIPATLTKHKSEIEIYFNYNSSLLNEIAVKKLTIWLYEQDNAASYSFTIKGHTDATGTIAYNKVLSQKRAYAIEKFLIEKGVKQITVQFFGEQFIKYSQNELNRRVEISY